MMRGRAFLGPDGWSRQPHHGDALPAGEIAQGIADTLEKSKALDAVLAAPMLQSGGTTMSSPTALIDRIRKIKSDSDAGVEAKLQATEERVVGVMQRALAERDDAIERLNAKAESDANDAVAEARAVVAEVNRITNGGP